MAEKGSPNRSVVSVFWIARVLVTLAAACLLFLIGVTMLDIVTRTFAWFQVRGVLELSSLTMTLLAYFGLAWGFLRKAHIVVDLATGHLSDRIKARVDRFWIGISAAWLAILACSVWQAGYTAHEYGERTVALGWSPLATSIPASLGLALAAVTCLLIAVSGRYDDGQEASPEGTPDV